MLFGLALVLSTTLGNHNNTNRCAPNPFTSNVNTEWQIHADWLSCSTQKVITIGDTTKAKMLYLPPTWKKQTSYFGRKKVATEASWTIVDMSNNTLSVSATNMTAGMRTRQFIDLYDCNGEIFAVLELLQSPSDASAPSLWILDDRGYFVARVYVHTIPVVNIIKYSVFACDGAQELKTGCPKSNTTKTVEFKSPSVFFLDIWRMNFEGHALHESLATDLRVISHIAALSASPRGISFCAEIIFILVAIPLCIIAVCLCIFHRRLCCDKSTRASVDESSLLTAGPEMIQLSEDFAQTSMTNTDAPANDMFASEEKSKEGDEW